MTKIVADLSVIQLVVWIGMAVAAWFYGMAAYGAWSFFRQRRPEDCPSDGWSPGVTILKPLKGLDRDLYENLRTFCRQAYPRFQIVCGVASASDPAAAVVRRLQREFRDLDIALVIDGRIHGTNYKVSNLINMMAEAKHEVIVLSDSDIRVPPDYLARVVAPLRDESIGLVSCLYRAVAADGLATELDALFINTDFCHQVLVARVVEQPTYAFGASMAIRRSTLEQIGGFRAVADLLADDYFLGHRVASRGLKLWLSDCVVETVLSLGSLKRLFQHQLRWARTFRSVRPLSYFATVVTHGTLFALLNLVVGGFSAAAICASMALVAWRMASVGLISWRFLRSDLRLPQIALVPVKDLFMSAVFFTAFAGNTVWWSGRRFRVLRTGEMELIAGDAGEAAIEEVVNQPS